MKKLFFVTIFAVIGLFFVSMFPTTAMAIGWGELVSTQAQHDAQIPGTNNSHFTRQWRTDGSWNGTEGYYRWTTVSQGEDYDGYSLNHPNTGTNSIYTSFIMRIGPAWTSHHVGGEFKFAMFYPVQDAGGSVPFRPTIFSWPTGTGGEGTHRTLLTCTNANGDGCRDEFGNNQN